eukprot:TRINITY_DN2159_c0_g1_i1.p1 TRINITY_DN2159_c0_g1~~TRINITY_DN2159_c0_g1_i1.p1  ORF type:complete len:295 (+),score=43.53 TRINITY_DN2159_c0_g1_i1:54-887(+)
MFPDRPLYDNTNFSHPAIPDWCYNNTEEYPYADWYLSLAQFNADHMEIPIISTILYVVLIFGIKRIMRDRQAFELKVPLFLWNLSLGIFSAIGFVMTFPVFMEVVLNKGISNELCFMESSFKNPWAAYFIYSKIPEFVDTIFIVLRKKPLIFLHWYHHIVTMWFCWVALIHTVGNGVLFAMVNLGVHGIMYNYYASTTVGMRWPKPVRMSITFIQIFQMFLGLGAVLHNIQVCFYEPHYSSLMFGLAMYISYVFLFVKLFYDNYCRTPKTAPKKKQD